ncbi:MAG: DUF1580 domain-containing protein [Planctomycetaceae bacterium]|nr:DUF1580 domain-containing protein [Phycisphaerales bacterium]MCE2654323.1 DUF1580 domain-containing protein [Planctomycetaceae bacterium]
MATPVFGHERLMPLAAAAKLVPSRSGGTVHFSTLCRWAHEGVRSVRLESALVGGIRMTSVEALQRFLTRLNQPRRGPSASAGHPLEISDEL